MMLSSAKHELPLSDFLSDPTLHGEYIFFPMSLLLALMVCSVMSDRPWGKRSNTNLMSTFCQQAVLPTPRSLVHSEALGRIRNDSQGRGMFSQSRWQLFTRTTP